MLESSLVCAVCVATWVLWAPAAAFQKRARGDHGGVSVFSLIPLFPVVACAAGVALNRVGAHVGTWVVGGGHSVLLLWFALSILRSRSLLRRHSARQPEG